MKRLTYLLIVFVFISCKGNENKKVDGNTADSTHVKEAKAVYTCPMHPEVISDKPGKCPQCGMDLEVKS